MAHDDNRRSVASIRLSQNLVTLNIKGSKHQGTVKVHCVLSKFFGYDIETIRLLET
jgi:hypothetical protein